LEVFAMSESSELTSPLPPPLFAAVHLAAAGFLARYSGRTRDAYTLDLKTYFAWCAERDTQVFAMTRPHLEIYVRWMEEQRGYAPATTARRLSTVAGFYRFAVIDGYLDRSPAEYVRRPHVPEESQALGLDRMQLGALVSAARASSPDDAALITMLGLLGLRISEACHADIADLGTERGHRTLHIIGKGNKPALIPLPVPVARTLDLAVAERGEGPILRTRSGARMEPLRGLADRGPTGQARRDHSPGGLPLLAALLHHRRPRRRCPAARRADRGPPRRPPDHD
jgi:site-specific recombinase XerC